MSVKTYDNVLQMTQRLSLTEQLRLLENLTQLVRHQVEARQRCSIMEIEGLGADIWQGIDAQAYVSQERDSWND
jgi:hypothetical protein